MFLFPKGALFGRSRNPLHKVECVTTYKLLGIIISNDLKWNEHIDYISKKASKHLYSLRILKKVGVNREGILKVYLTTIRPILEYVVQVWQDIPEFLSKKGTTYYLSMQ